MVCCSGTIKGIIGIVAACASGNTYTGFSNESWCEQYRKRILAANHKTAKPWGWVGQVEGSSRLALPGSLVSSQPVPCF